MIALVSHYALKPGSRDKAIATMQAMKSGIMGLPGMTHFSNVMKADETGYVIATIENEDLARENEPEVKKLWAAYGEFLKDMPAIETCEVVADWPE